MAFLKENKFIGLIFIIIIADQVLKIWTKSNMYTGESIPILGNWFSFLFVENSGMGLGLKPINSNIKLLLTLFRVVSIGAIIVLFIYFRNKNKQKVNLYLSLILAGSISNCIDNIFYGVIFSYAPLLYGSIVDVFHISVKTTDSYVVNSVFNIADISICIGIIGTLIMCIRKVIYSVEKI